MNELQGPQHLVGCVETLSTTSDYRGQIQRQCLPCGRLTTLPTANECTELVGSREHITPHNIQKASLQAPHMAQATTDSPAVIEADTFDEHDRTQVLLAKYNLDIDFLQPQWPSRSPFLERVSKPIRMRVRYTCHRCNTSFGHEKECNSCRHRRCGKCDRNPPRKPRRAPESQNKTAAPAAPVEPTTSECLDVIAADHLCACHECQTIIEMTVEECPNCHHTICERCHKEARIQPVDEREMEETSRAERAEMEQRKAPPEEPSLPPDTSLEEEQQQPPES